MIENNGQQMIESELDIQRFCHLLWQGRKWLIGCTLLGAVLALIYSFLVQQQWSAFAVTDKPTMSQLSNYYSQRQLLEQITQPVAQNNSDTTQGSIADQIYAEFLLQLKSYDNQRQFWLNSAYYQKQKSGTGVDAQLLDKLIKSFQFTSAVAPDPGDGIRLVADSAQDASDLLRQYIDFVANKTVKQLDDSLIGRWSAIKVMLANRINQEKAQANADYQNKIKQLAGALLLAKKNHITSSENSTSSTFANGQLFLLGESLLANQLDAMQLSGPSYSDDYTKNQAWLMQLDKGPQPTATFSPYRYLRTPEYPAFRDSPRRGLLLVIWAAIGLLVGGGIALARKGK